MPSNTNLGALILVGIPFILLMTAVLYQEPRFVSNLLRGRPLLTGPKKALVCQSVCGLIVGIAISVTLYAVFYHIPTV